MPTFEDPKSILSLAVLTLIHPSSSSFCPIHPAATVGWDQKIHQIHSHTCSQIHACSWPFLPPPLSFQGKCCQNLTYPQVVWFSAYHKQWRDWTHPATNIIAMTQFCAGNWSHLAQGCEAQTLQQGLCTQNRSVDMQHSGKGLMFAERRGDWRKSNQTCDKQAQSRRCERPPKPEKGTVLCNQGACWHGKRCQCSATNGSRNNVRRYFKPDLH